MAHPYSSFSPEALDAVRQQWPHLKEIPEDAKSGASLTHATANMRLMLKAKWPNARFWVTCERASMMTAIRVRWVSTGQESDLNLREVKALLTPFVHSTFDGSTDSTLSVPTNREFRELFGSTKFLDFHPPTPEMEVEYRAKTLKKALPKPSTPQRGPRF